MSKSVASYWDILKIFTKTGACSFGGWSTTAVLLDKELVKTGLLTDKQLKGAVAYAQILPGATQVSIVANAGYKLRKFKGALIATVGYLTPAVCLITIFAAAYFHYQDVGAELIKHAGGLIAALCGVILANAYKIGAKHTAHKTLWLCVALAFCAKLFLGVNALLIILVFGAAGLLFSWHSAQKAAK